MYEWEFEFAKQWIDKVVKGVDRGKSRHVVAFVFLNRKVDFLAGESLSKGSIELFFEHGSQSLGDMDRIFIQCISALQTCEMSVDGLSVLIKEDIANLP